MHNIRLSVQRPAFSWSSVLFCTKYRLMCTEFSTACILQLMSWRLINFTWLWCLHFIFHFSVVLRFRVIRATTYASRVVEIISIVYLRQKRRYMFLPMFVCLSVCLSVSKITQKGCMDLDEMLRVDRRLGTWTNWLTFEPDPDYSPDAGTGLLSPICAATRNFITSGKSNL